MQTEGIQSVGENELVTGVIDRNLPRTSTPSVHFSPQLSLPRLTL
jgi:hypothetical protein